MAGKSEKITKGRHDLSTIEPRWPRLAKAGHALTARGKQEYNPAVMEPKWQEKWQEEKTYAPDLKNARKPYYNLMMFPYPSAEGLHVGNVYAFTGADVWGRFQRMKGMDVFEPIGLDGFGIHSENYAIKIGAHPVLQAQKAEVRFYNQLLSIGNGFAWDYRLETYDPDYYRWTQWVFVQMFKKGLAYRQKAAVNWCPSCKTVLADEQVIADKCERCGSVVEKRDLEQWFFRITDYTDRLLENLDMIDWAEKVKIAQRNWIGKKEGIEIEYAVENSEYRVKVFTTRPDTNFGATFLVLAPEHLLIKKITTEENRESVSKYIEDAKSKSEKERIAQGKKKAGAFTGSYALNQLTGERMPIWVSDFVLMVFGTGAVVGVPGHDMRDFQFAKKFGLPIKRVVVGVDGDDSEITDENQVQEEEGRMVNSDFLDGMDIHEATVKIMDYIEEKGYGKRVTAYHLRDWLISRQRYWGPPIPMIYCQSCASADKSWFTTQEASSHYAFDRNNNVLTGMAGWYPVPEDQLPVELPYIENYRPTGTGESPLSQDKEWVKAKCPGCGGESRRETDVSDTFLDSAWYFLRYPSVNDDKEPWNTEVTKKWLPVDMYIGGAEHSVLHLMYARFLTMCFKDWGLVDFEEPFTRFYAHGLVIKDGSKMSKSKGNVIVPDEYIKKHGADTVRIYLMFMSPFDQGGDFRDTGVEGMNRFLRRVWNLFFGKPIVLQSAEESQRLYHIIHKTTKRVTEDLENLRYNRAIAGIMEYVNALQEIALSARQIKSKAGVKCAEWDEALRTLLLVLAPFAPHLSEELWSLMYADQNADQRRSVKDQRDSAWSVHLQKWPEYDEELVKEDTTEIPVQVNGRLRGTVIVDSDDAKNEALVTEEAKKQEGVFKYIAGKEVSKVVFVPGRLINFVTS